MRYVIQRVSTGHFWSSQNRWTSSVASARWFDSYDDAELAGLRELPDPRPDWRVATVSDDGHVRRAERP